MKTSTVQKECRLNFRNGRDEILRNGGKCTRDNGQYIEYFYKAGEGSNLDTTAIWDREAEDWTVSLSIRGRVMHSFFTGVSSDFFEARTEAHRVIEKLIKGIKENEK